MKLRSFWLKAQEFHLQNFLYELHLSEQLFLAWMSPLWRSVYFLFHFYWNGKIKLPLLAGLKSWIVDLEPSISYAVIGSGCWETSLLLCFYSLCVDIWLEHVIFSLSHRLYFLLFVSLYSSFGVFSFSSFSSSYNRWFGSRTSFWWISYTSKKSLPPHHHVLSACSQESWLVFS